VDQFEDPARWSFETQSALLLAKVAGLAEALRFRNHVLVDRSVAEDSEVFARYFLQAGFMDQRSYETYSNLAYLVQERVPPPDLYVMCRCSAETCSARLAVRPRAYQSSYPAEFLSDLEDLYETWWEQIRGPTVELDTEHVDFRTRENARKLASAVRAKLAQSRRGDRDQLELFDGVGAEGEYLPLAVTVPPHFRPSPGGSSSERPIAYIAAPFTGVAAAADATPVDQEQGRLELEGMGPEHSGIPVGPYRRTLLALAQALDSRGYRALLPHRDINRWGSRRMTSAQVAEECLAAVKASHLFVGVLGTSFGAHSEASTAIALGIPTILFSIRGEPESFFASGIRSSGLCVSEEVGSLRQIVDMVAGDHFQELSEVAAVAVSRSRLVGGPFR
jgi:deoxyadenosine/deoxycytidine kinase